MPCARISNCVNSMRYSVVKAWNLWKIFQATIPGGKKNFLLFPFNNCRERAYLTLPIPLSFFQFICISISFSVSLYFLLRSLASLLLSPCFFFRVLVVSLFVFLCVLLRLSLSPLLCHTCLFLSIFVFLVQSLSLSLAISSSFAGSLSFFSLLLYLP